ncbi:MAG TPA: ElyC/SanA/YdcF family protein, partial [Verrucomicrobiota bacterium]|nr:ElyC/SanA/YdcF family protein [Verrucomicrobiota bacterium]
MATDSKSPVIESKLWGMVTRKPRWAISWKGWLVLVGVGGLTVGLFVTNIYGFLAVNKPVTANLLVVEGWVHDYAIRVGVEEFRTGKYDAVFATGGPVAGTGAYTSDFKTSAHVGAGLLLASGLPPDKLVMVPSRVSSRDRTYGAALALKQYFQEQGTYVNSLNVVTENVHARRTRLLYQEAFGPDVKIGIIAARNPDYDSR